MDAEKTVKVLSKALTALVSLRALFRSGLGIKKLLVSPKKNPVASTNDVKQKQLHGALLGMGYSRSEVDRTIKELGSKIESDSLSDLVRTSLGILNH